MAEQFLTLMADLDEASQERLRGWYDKLKGVGFTGTQTPDVPYHISLATFPPDREQEAAEIARKAAAEFAPVPVHLSHIGMFAGGKVLFCGPEKDAGLAALREACKPSVPETWPWTPHVSLLIDEPEMVYAAIPHVMNCFVPFTGTITRLHLCAFWPTREVAAYRLSGRR